MTNIQVLKLTKAKELFFTTAFVALAVLAPMGFHFFGGVGAGRIFLPMHFFVLTAGLILGWRAGLATGAFSVLISYLISSMPAINVLPFIAIELSVYGLVAGLLKDKFNVWISLFGALAFGRLAVLMTVFLFSNMNALNFVFAAARDGWQGIALQVIFIPVVVEIISSSLFQREVNADAIN
jgi:niacin transporter